LRRLSQAPVEVRGAIASDDPLWAGTDVDLAGPLAIEGTAGGSPTRGIWVRGSFSGRLKAACRRCLEPLDLAVAEEFELLFDPKAPESQGDLTLYALDARADELDLRPPLSERFLLAVPAYPECRDECPGLCAHCGASLAEGDCGCDPAEPDPRWGPLRALRGED
jgi:uncharacterized protein